MKARNKGGILLVSIFFIIIVVLAVLVLSLREDPIKSALREGKGVLKTLFVLEHNNQVLFSDVLMSYHLTASEKDDSSAEEISKRGVLINIPGNTGGIWRSLDRADRIDAIYSEKGIGVYKSEIENLLGQPIPFYILMSLEEFSEITDLLGGMSVFIPNPVDIKNVDGQRWLLPSGAINLDGDKVKTYLMYTEADESENDIVDRRQNVVLAFFNAIARNADVFRDSDSFFELSMRFQSNLSRSRQQDLFGEIMRIDPERLAPQAITGTYRTVDGKLLIFPLQEGQYIKQVVTHAIRQLKDKGQGEKTNYSLRIQNGTKEQGLAAKTKNLLSSNYDILEYGNADSNEYEKTVIIDHIGNSESAKLLGDFIKCENIREELDANTSADFTIILGNDFDGRYVR